MKMKTYDVELYCESHGKGRPIVFSHAWLEDCSIWDSQVKNLSKVFAVILYDRSCANIVLQMVRALIISSKWFRAVE
jgi:pimeloyl-ACP methyl ester carboxylesterase